MTRQEARRQEQEREAERMDAFYGDPEERDGESEVPDERD
jgi:hypothetical protein